MIYLDYTWWEGLAAEKFHEFGKSLMICIWKTINLICGISNSTNHRILYVKIRFVQTNVRPIYRTTLTIPVYWCSVYGSLAESPEHVRTLYH